MFNVHSRILGTGMYVPDKILTNNDLKKLVDEVEVYFNDLSVHR